MTGRRGRAAAIGIAAMLGAAAVAQSPRPVPYWASLAAGDALMRTGPGREYPATWRYRRPELPLKVVAVHTSWRKVREPDGTEGWMAAVLLTDQRTAIVTGAEPAALRASPDASGRVLWRAEPGVTGKIAKCAGGWCQLDVRGRAGFIEIARLWGVEPGETVD